MPQRLLNYNPPLSEFLGTHTPTLWNVPLVGMLPVTGLLEVTVPSVTVLTISLHSFNPPWTCRRAPSAACCCRHHPLGRSRTCSSPPKASCLNGQDKVLEAGVCELFPCISRRNFGVWPLLSDTLMGRGNDTLGSRQEWKPQAGFSLSLHLSAISLILWQLPHH